MKYYFYEGKKNKPKFLFTLASNISGFLLGLSIMVLWTIYREKECLSYSVINCVPTCGEMSLWKQKTIIEIHESLTEKKKIYL